MNNKRIDLTWLEGDKDEVAGTIEDNICGDYDYVENLLTELKRCYELIDTLPTREGLNEMHDYTKWLETVELYFIANGSFNQDADFVRMCAVNEKYGYRIEVINGVETVVHESEY